MTKTLRELDTALDELAGSLPAQLADSRPDEHADALAPVMSALLADTPAAHYDHVWGRLQCIQRDAGLIFGDDELCRESR
ncbi:MULTISPECIES: hypothetical protein [Pseudoxanthomonas]|jgi:hypothetical protein|uniref:Uncharacterized protein n=1 Tax=Pseudoxanthomonas mexicana TaxID=128785 RepID=A0ABX6RD69_PSEMX|nr:MULTISPECIES: hypothetical protein [Pseudoxanthomonas]QLQ29215.1 MAG: hypothetical protein HZT39_14120 [Pseudoxanthomonas sp.]QND80966.1 hypothetical protein H4W19_04000 [Pseudoxanthomonas mexicana]